MRKLSKLFKHLVCFALIIFISSQSIQAQAELSEIYLIDAAPDYEFSSFMYDFTSTDIHDFFHLENNGKYPSVNLFDGYFNTCWLAGSSKTDKHSMLYIRIPGDIDIGDLILNIFSGYGKNKQLYFNNSRPKKIKISIFSAFHPESFSTEVASLYIIEKFPLDKEIVLADTFGVQCFTLGIDKKELLEFQQELMLKCKSFTGKDYLQFSNVITTKTFIPSIVLKMEITDVYLGTKYDDICISELFFNDRFITTYSDSYNEIRNVYIENDNTLLVDYIDKKGVVIYKDSSSVFTMVDWPGSSNWAVLHFTPNNEVGIGSRTEEYYSLIDLKRSKIADVELKKCTGISPMFQTIEKTENGRIFINNGGKYKVELK